MTQKQRIRFHEIKVERLIDGKFLVHLCDKEGRALVTNGPVDIPAGRSFAVKGLSGKFNIHLET